MLTYLYCIAPGADVLYNGYFCQYTTHVLAILISILHFVKPWALKDMSLSANGKALPRNQYKFFKENLKRASTVYTECVIAC